MDDQEIVELYFKRSEAAIAETERKYSQYCSTIANNILHSVQEAEECVNETWFKAWGTIPPNRPLRLSVFLGKITRNLSIDRYRRANREKRGCGQVSLCLEELAECVGCGQSITDDIALKELLNQFLKELKPKARRVFMLRYWYMYSVKDIGENCSMSAGAVKMSLKRTRMALKEYLEKEGVPI
ncbi:RNA polymerase sigma factor [Anaerosporobacter faecicola]|uniref:RNA polymerase sigma factor n=1 Tax=Anaerosporobacter faecicola TaxID=2718714 RepID=UPI001438E717|nr:RNA polymerase sigma factor [Anaerosporobacter faecicola]